MKFNTNNSFFQFMGTLVSFVGLNIVLILTCIPVFTIGTAFASLHATTIKYIENEDIPLTKTYLKNFKSSFKSSTLIFLIWAAFVAVVGFNLAFWSHFSSIISIPVVVVMAVALFVAVLIGEFLFPLTARYQNNLKQTFKNAILIAIGNFLKGILLILIDLAAIALSYVSEFARVMMLLFGFAFVAYLKSFVLSKVFARYSEK